MEPIKNLAQAEKALQGFVPAARKFREAVVSLENMRELMESLGNPQNAMKVVHVAGSSGKTSTSYYMAAHLKATGKKVGLTVSPHIDSVNERVQINLKPLSEKVFCSKLQKFLNILRETSVKPTYFELLVAFAFWSFKEEQVDYAVVEVGLGGLLDATNVITRRDKVCIITDIGLDHTELLGHTLASIAAQKAGIIRENNTVFCYQQSNEVMDVIREVANQKWAELHEVVPVKAQDLIDSLPLFQQRNWYLAHQTFQYLRQRDGLPELSDKRLGETTSTYVPARMETVELDGKTIIMDGAHNPQKMQMLMRSLRRQYPDKKVAALIAVLKSKRPRAISTLKELTGTASYIIVTNFDTRQDMRKLSLDPIKAAEYLEELGYSSWEIETNHQQALVKLLKRKEDILVITGSFYLLNHMRPYIRK